MAGHSPSKTGVNALLSRPSMSLLTRCRQGVDTRDKRGHDTGQTLVLWQRDYPAGGADTFTDSRAIIVSLNAASLGNALRQPLSAKRRSA